MQETLLNAYAGLRAFEPGTNLHAWLRRTMINTYISSYRRQRCRPTQNPIGEITDRQLVATAPRTPRGLRSAEDQALEMLPDPSLKAAMMVLPEKFRVVVYFADIAGYSYKEIAAMTDTRQGTVGSRLRRGRKQLRALLSSSPINHAGRAIGSAHSGAIQQRALVDAADRRGGHPAANEDGPVQPRPMKRKGRCCMSTPAGTESAVGGKPASSKVHSPSQRERAASYSSDEWLVETLMWSRCVAGSQ